jgi:3-dehydroquinate synthase
MQRTVIEVNLGERSYPIVVTSGELGQMGDFARSRVPPWQAMVVADEGTKPLFYPLVAKSLEQAGFRTRAADVLPCGEGTKSLGWAEQLFANLISMSADRQTLVVALGGGVVGDLAGFVAATYARGIPFMQVPTSLLAQVDSSVGGKVAVNYHHPTLDQTYKNIIGAFYQPMGVFIDTETLRKLPATELRAGLAEVVKYGVILDAEFFTFLETNVDAILALDPTTTRHIVARSCRLKADVVEADEREVTGRRAILNYGHTFAHAIEAVTRQYRHGEAVAIGMIAASRLAEQLGRIAPDVTVRQIQLLQRFGLPTAAPGLNTDTLLHAIQHDKKMRAGRFRFVLPNGIGQVELVDGIDESIVRAVLTEMTDSAYVK